MLALAAVLFVVAAFVATFNAHISGYVLDETLIKQSAVHYTRGLPHNLFHDVTARATSRLYSLLIAAAFAVADGDVAVRASRALNAVLFMSAAVPAYVLAAPLFRERVPQLVVAGLCALVPWLTLSTALFTENLAYPLFLWCVVAMVAAYRRPAAWKDALVICGIGLAVGTRTQLLALGVAYAVVVARRLVDDAVASGFPVGVAFVRHQLRRFPASALLAGGILVATLYGIYSGTLSDQARRLLGAYAATTTDQPALPRDVLLSTGVEILGLACGLGLIPVIAALAWLPGRWSFRYPSTLPAVAYARVTAIVCVALFLTTLYSQQFYLGAATEERYFFYAAPLLLIAGWYAVCAGVSRASMATAGAVVVTLAAVITLPRNLKVPESALFAPALATTQSGIDFALLQVREAIGRQGMSSADTLAVLMFVGLVLALAAWKALPRWGRVVSLAVSATVQLAVLVAAFAAIGGLLSGVPGRLSGSAFPAQGFIDRNTDRTAVWFDNQPKLVGAPEDEVQRNALLYNDDIRSRGSLGNLNVVPDNFPLNSLPVDTYYAEAGGELQSRLSGLVVGEQTWVQTLHSPFAQVAGTRLAVGPSAWNLELVRGGRPTRLAWLQTGLDGGGRLQPPSAARFRIWGRRIPTFVITASDAATVSVATGSATAKHRLAAQQRVAITVGECGIKSGSLAASASITVHEVRLRRC